MTLRTIIAEDEPTLRSQLKAKLSTLWPELAIVAEVGDGEAALQAIDTHRPTLAFLDIQMPEMTGLEVAYSMAANPEINCHVVFVTAFDQFAVDAFQAGAADYLLKPFSDDRLALAVQRLKERLALQPSLPQDLQTMLKRISAQLTPQSYPLRWIKASVGSHLRLIPIDEVLFFQSGEKYTTVATRELDALIRTPIKALLESLDPSQFWQIHRSAIVNVGAIEGVTRDAYGQAAVRIRGRNEILSVSRPFSHLFKQM
jgi:DNA-binding LytR/AlgR family response regulator